jgi:hypothetical protein
MHAIQNRAHTQRSNTPGKNEQRETNTRKSAYTKPYQTQ